MASQQPDEALVGTLKRAGAALGKAGVPFAVAGGFAAWARGAPPTEHDVDFLVLRDDAEVALAALAEAGMRPEHPPEDWLVKAWDGEVLVDLIFAPAGFETTDDLLARAEEINVAGITLPILPATDIFVSRLLALSDHHLDLEALLTLARALREQVDWDRVRERVGESPFARAFLYLLEELGIIAAPEVGRRRWSA